MESLSTEAGVTVVVSTLNRPRVLVACLRDLVAQRHRPLEILVVDQSDEESPEVARFAGDHQDLVRHHRVSFRGLPAARNYGWQLAGFEVVLFVDDDIRCGPELVSEHLRALRLPGVGVVAGGIEGAAGPPNEPTGRFSRWTASPSRGFQELAEKDVEHAQGCNFSAWRRILREVGGFDERFQAGAALYEETDLCLRVKEAGHRIFFNPVARLTHLGDPAGGCRVRNIAEYVRGLTHNRTIMIERHLRWPRRPIAAVRLLLLSAAYARAYGAPAVLWQAVRGIIAGHGHAALAPLCTVWGETGA